MSNVTIIPAKKNNSTENTSGCLTKVAAYCRVSTAEENQQNSYATQIAYYTEYITSHQIQIGNSWAYSLMRAFLERRQRTEPSSTK